MYYFDMTTNLAHYILTIEKEVISINNFLLNIDLIWFQEVSFFLRGALFLTGFAAGLV